MGISIRVSGLRTYFMETVSTYSVQRKLLKVDSDLEVYKIGIWWKNMI